MKKNPSPVDVATVAAILLSRAGSTLSQDTAIQEARALIERAGATAERMAVDHVHPKIAFMYKGANWRSLTLNRIAHLFETDLPPDDNTPPEFVNLRSLPRKGWKSPEDFLSYHERRGLEAHDVKAIQELIRRDKRIIAREKARKVKAVKARRGMH